MAWNWGTLTNDEPPGPGPKPTGAEVAVIDKSTVAPVADPLQVPSQALLNPAYYPAK